MPQIATFMRYVTINELSQIIRDNLSSIPRDIDLVVGIPRSGMLAAEMIALYLNIQLSDIDSFAEGRVYSVGLTRSSDVVQRPIHRVLVVDDSINSGRAMDNARRRLQPIADKYDLTYMAVIASSHGEKLVDISCTRIDDVRVFEWNLFEHGILQQAFCDIDGVLCDDPLEDDDGEKYRNFILTAKPKFLPTIEIDTLITCRLEKYRTLTEQWLKEHNVRYRHLIMLNMPSRDARRQWGKHGEWKGMHYRNSDSLLFIESSSWQAEQIAKASGKPVIDLEQNRLISTARMPLKQRLKRRLRKRYPKLLNWLLRLRHGRTNIPQSIPKE
ncbi:MAG: phosphoribosyl transferase [Bacteroidales bacterium]|nr:phosphoribosyl transferase [Bacteroidales bacterium]